MDEDYTEAVSIPTQAFIPSPVVAVAPAATVPRVALGISQCNQLSKLLISPHILPLMYGAVIAIRDQIIPNYSCATPVIQMDAVVPINPALFSRIFDEFKQQIQLNVECQWGRII